MEKKLKSFVKEIVNQMTNKDKRWIEILLYKLLKRIHMCNNEDEEETLFG